MDSSGTAGEEAARMDGKSRLSMLYSNVQSLKNKMNELRAVVSLERPDIIALTETWTNEGVDKAFLQIEGEIGWIRREEEEVVL